MRGAASGACRHCARLSAMIFVDCMAASLKVAYSTTSRSTRAPSLCSVLRRILELDDDLVEGLDRVPGHALEQKTEIVGDDITIMLRLPPRGRSLPAAELRIGTAFCAELSSLAGSGVLTNFMFDHPRVAPS